MASGRYRLGVALLLDPPVADEVDGLRRALGDPALGRIPAHLTLVPPVNVRTDQLPAALARLRAAASVVGGPIQLTLGSPTSFLPFNPVLYLDVGGDTGELRRLRDAVFAPPLERKLSWPWVPHVTLADGIEETRIRSGLAALDRFAVVWPVERLVLLQENSGRLWRPLADVALGPPVVVGTGGLALEITGSRAVDPEAQQMLAGAGLPMGPGSSTGPGERRPPFFPIVMTGRRQGQLEGVAAAWAEPARGHVAVYVRPASRRQGVGSHLLARVEVAARRAGWSYEWLEGAGPEQFYLSRGEWVRPTRTPPPRTAPAS